MLAYISGKITLKTDNSIVIENNGMGYEIFVTNNALSTFGYEQTKVYVYMNVKEDGITLFGFKDIFEKEMFLKLISVSGVGPKGAISILNGASAEDLALAIMRKDALLLSTFKGVGKKTAERIVLELNEKVAKMNIEVPTNVKNQNMSIVNETIFALTTLGVPSASASKLVQENYKENISIEELLRICLKERK